MKPAHLIILMAITASVIGTFFVANTVTGLTVSKLAVSNSGFGSVTGNAVASSPAQLKGMQAAASSGLFGLLSLAALVVVARIGANTLKEAEESSSPNIQTAIEKAESKARQGSYPAAATLYKSIKQQYAQLDPLERLEYYARIIDLHRQLAKQAVVAEANYLTDKYVGGTITEQEFERLRRLIVSQ